MNASQSPGFGAIALLMFSTGIGIPILAALNAGLAQRIGSPLVATAVLFAVGLLLSLGAVAATGARGTGLTAVPPYLYLGAGFMVFYILSVTWAAPRVGLGNAIFFVLLGQLVAAATIDHFALFGALRFTITPRRVAGIAVMMLGVYLARKPR